MAKVFNRPVHVGGYVRLGRYTEDERDALTNMEAGDMIFNTTDSAVNVYNGTDWDEVTVEA